MEKLDKVIAGIKWCWFEDQVCRGCPYEGSDEDSDCGRNLERDTLEVLRTLGNDVLCQSETILELNRDLKRCRKALNAQGEYAYLGGDLISREALIEKIEEIDWYSVNGHMVMTEGAPNEERAYVRYADVARVVEAAAAVEVEPHMDEEVADGN